MKPLPRTRFLTRLAGGVALLALLGLGVSACDTSPYAATVNRQVLSSSTLNADLRNFSANTKLVSALSSQGAHVWGATTSSYSNTFVAGQLTTLVDARVVSQYLAAHHLRPSTELLDATRAVEQLTYGPDWTGFSPAYRDSIVQRDADHALIEPLVIGSSTLRQTYAQYRSRFWSETCVRALTITANRANGSVDLPASEAQAERLVNSINRRNSAAAARAVRGGTYGCYTPRQLENQPFGYDVLGVRTYHASRPTRQSFGYRVLVVTRRDLLPLHPAVAMALNGYYIEAGDAVDTKLNHLAQAASIQVNAAYGSWDNTRKVSGANRTLVSAGVVPPASPNTAKQRPVRVEGVGSALVGGLAKP